MYNKKIQYTLNLNITDTPLQVFPRKTNLVKSKSLQSMPRESEIPQPHPKDVVYFRRLHKKNFMVPTGGETDEREINHLTRK